jgi:hypothetical protein
VSRLKVLSAALEQLDVIQAVLTAGRTEMINGDNVLSFTTVLTEENTELINDTNVIGLDDDYFDIAFYKKGQDSNGELMVDVECEHISYRLNDPAFDVEYFTETGTPEYILGKILFGTGFTAGAVDFVEATTYSAQQKMSRRGLLMSFIALLGGEVLFDGLTVSIVTHRGSAVPKNLPAGRNISIVSKSVNKRERDALGNPIVSFECELINPMALALGDVVTLDYETLGIDISLRIVRITTNPYNSEEVSFEIGNYVNSLEDDLYRIETQAVKKDALMNGIRIGPEYGFEAVRNDKLARAFFRSDAFSMQKGDGSGSSWVDSIYFDPILGKYKITGDVVIEGSIASDADFTDSLYAEQGDVSQLRVDWLQTSNKLWKYLNDDYSDDDYWDIHGSTISHIASRIVTPHVEVQLVNRYGDDLYWNGNINAATLNEDGWPELAGTRLYLTKDVTEWPANIYQYTELTKGKWEIIEVDGVKVDRIVMGAGTGSEYPDQGKFIITKYVDHAAMEYQSATDASKTAMLTMNNGGFVDATHRRTQSIIWNKSTGKLSILKEGEDTPEEADISVVGNTVTITRTDGFVSTAEVTT